MPSCCQSKHTCLAERHRAMRLNGPFGWQIPCMDCIEGAARQMDNFTPEPDYEPIPLRNTGKPKNPPTKCAQCGELISRGASLCKKHWGLARRINHDKCSVKGCRWLARRAGMCQSHYFAKRQADTKAYREKAHAIAEYRAQVPKQRQVREG